MYVLEDKQGYVVSTHDDYDSALQAAEEYAGPDGVVGHDGDLAEGGDKTLVWGSWGDAENDAGANSCASIRRASE